MSERVHVWVSGLVQGVGFRYSAARQARALGLTGWVRNLPDGRVEAEFEGGPNAVDQMVEWCREGPAFSRVSDVQVHRETGEERHSAFQIVD